MFKQAVIAFCTIVGALTTANTAWERFIEYKLQREIRDDPVRVDNVIYGVTREVGRLCWYWSSTKVRDLRAFNEDVFLETPDDTVFVAIMDDRGRYWSRKRSPPPGHDDRRLCVYVDPDMPLNVPMTLRETIYFHGTWGTLQFHVPDVQWPAPGEAPAHDSAPTPLGASHNGASGPENDPVFRDRVVDVP